MKKLGSAVLLTNMLFAPSAALPISADSAPAPAYNQQAEQAPSSFAKMIEYYKCSLPLCFDAGGRYVGVIIKDNKIRIRTYDVGDSKTKDAFLANPDLEKKINENTYIYEISTKGEAPYGTSPSDGFRGLVKNPDNSWASGPYVGGDKLKTEKDEFTGKAVVDLFNELFSNSILPALKSCPQK